MKLGLTPAQLLERRKGIGGSDARKIVDGEWYELWLDKTGRKEPEDLSRVLAVQMGNATEEFNAYWYTLTTGRYVTCRGMVRQSRAHPFMRCSLDGLACDDDKPVHDADTVWQAKHVNAFSKIEEVVARYTPQVTHEMIVCGLSMAVLSVFIGTDKYEAVEIEIDEFFAAQYVESCKRFWGFVERDEEPPGGPALAVPTAPEKMRKVSMADSNVWGNYAALWLSHKLPAEVFADATKRLKELVEADVSEASGHGIIAKRDKRGLSIKEVK